MPIKFTCPEKKITDEFSDAYAGIEFKCKRCGNYHTIPLKADFKRKELLLTCAITGSILSVDPDQPSHEFQCVACKGVHQIPGRNPSPGAPLAISSLFQKHNREAVIPSQRKASPLSPKGGSTDRRNETNRKLIKTDKTQRERSPILNVEDEVENRPPVKRKKKKKTLSNIILLLVFLCVGASLYFVITQVNKEKSLEDNLTSLMLEAQAKLNRSEFQESLSIIDDVLSKLEPKDFQITGLKISKEATLKKREEVLACQEAYQTIYNRYAPTLQSNNLDIETILKAEALLKEEIHILRPKPNLKPAVALLDKFATSFKETAVELEQKLIDDIFSTAEKHYATENYTEAFYHYSSGLSRIDAQAPNDAAASKEALKAYIKTFDTRIENFAKANDIVKAVQANQANLDESIKKIEEFRETLPSKDNTMRQIYRSFIQDLKIIKKIQEIKKIEALSGLSDEQKIAQLIKLLPSYPIAEYPATKEVLSIVSKLKKGLSQTEPTKASNLGEQADEEQLKKDTSIVKKWAQSLAKVLGQLNAKEITIDASKANLKFKVNSQNWSISTRSDLNGTKMIVIVDGVKLIYHEDVIEKIINDQPEFLMQHIHYLRARLITNNAPVEKEWEVTQGAFATNLPCAFYLDDQQKLFMLNDQIFKVNKYRSLYPSKSALHAELMEAKNTLIKNITKLEGSLEQKNTICELAETLVPLSSRAILDQLAYKNIVLSKIYRNIAPKEKPILDEIEKFTNHYNRLLLDKYEWFSGTDWQNNSIAIEANRIDGDKISIRVYNSSDVNTKLYYTFTPNLTSREPRACYRFSFSSTYHGNHREAPDSAPSVVSTYHSAFGEIAQYSPHDKKLTFHESPWKEINSFDASENNLDETKLAPHAILFNSKFQLESLLLPVHAIDTKVLGQSPSWIELSSWITENKSKLFSIENLSTFIYYFVLDSKNLNQLNLKFLPDSQKNISSYFYKVEHRLAGTAGSINRIIAKLNEEKQTPYLIAFEKNKFANLWTEQIVGKNYLFTHQNGILYKTLIQNELRDIRTNLVRNFPTTYISPFKIPSAFYNEKGDYWSFANIASIYLKPDIQHSTRLKILNAMRHKCLLQIPNIIKESPSKNIKGKELFDYFIFEEYSDYNAAVQSLNVASESLQISNLFVTLFEKAQIESSFKHKKEVAKNYQEIYKITVDSNLLSANAASLTDLRFKLAEIMATLAKPEAASEILKHEITSNQKLSREAMNTFANVAYTSRILSQKDELAEATFTSYIGPLQARLNDEIDKEFSKPSIDLENIFSLSKIKMMLAISKSNFDEVTSNLLTEPNFDTKTQSENFIQKENTIYYNHFRINGNLASASLEEWCKINPLCFLFVVDQYLSDNFKEDTKLDLKIKISMKFIEAFQNNILKSKELIKQPFLKNEEIKLLTLKSLYDQKFEEVTKNIALLYNNNKPVSSFIDLLYPIIDQNDFAFNKLIEEFKKTDLPSLFYLDLLKKFYAKKSRQNFKLLVDFIQSQFKNDPQILKEIDILNKNLSPAK